MLDPNNLWVKFFLHVFIGTVAGGFSDVVAVHLLFRPRTKRFGIQGAIPKNHQRLARSIGRMVGERLLTASDIHQELNRPELRDAFERAVHDYLPAAMGNLGVYLSEPGTREKIRTLLRSLFDRYTADMRFHERLVARVVMSESRFERVLDTIENDGVDQLAILLDDPGVREDIARSVTPVVWTKLQEELPELLHKLDVQGIVERKVMAFSSERVEELMRGVMQSELNMIITSGYVLGAVIGVGTFALSQLIGL
jgi:uncharacterized membrane protein YheB (UPF0754 family)